MNSMGSCYIQIWDQMVTTGILRCFLLITKALDLEVVARHFSSTTLWMTDKVDSSCEVALL